MRHKFLVLTVKKWLKSVYIYGSYRKIKTGVPLFLDHSVYDHGTSILQTDRQTADNISITTLHSALNALHGLKNCIILSPTVIIIKLSLKVGLFQVKLCLHKHTWVLP